MGIDFGFEDQLEKIFVVGFARRRGRAVLVQDGVAEKFDVEVRKVHLRNVPQNIHEKCVILE